MKVRSRCAAALAALWVLLFLALPATGLAQPGSPPPALTSLDFEEGEPGQVPPGWTASKNPAKGYAVRLVTDNPQGGRMSAQIAQEGEKEDPQAFGILMRTMDATPYRGKRIRFRAAVRSEILGGGENLAGLWLRVDQPAGRGFFDNMRDRPITSPEWKSYEIVGEVSPDAQSISLGALLIGTGKLWVDSASFEVVEATDDEPARPLAGRGVDNLVAFTRLLGYVRHFHPSDQAAAADWDLVAIAGVQAAEGAADPADLAERLEAFFRPLAPTVRVFPTSQERPALPAELAPPTGTAEPEVTAWEHLGVRLDTPSQAYSSQRISSRPDSPRKGKDFPRPNEPLVANLGGGVSALIPLALYKDAQGTLPHPVPDTPLPSPRKPAGFTPSGNDRATRLAGVALAWNVFQHFYPYFDVVETDWRGELRLALGSAATDADEWAYLSTLRRLVAALKDGHGGVSHPAPGTVKRLPVSFAWVEDQLVVTDTAPEAGGLARGDVIVSLNGKPAREVLEAEMALVSGATPQWRRYRAMWNLTAVPEGEEVKVTARRGGGEPFPVTLRRSLPLGPESLEEKRPEKIAEVRPGIFYVDAGRINDEDFKGAVDRLAAARGVVFDLRGYPANLSPIAISHLTGEPVTSARWQIPLFTRPDREGMTFEFSNWPVKPLEPRFQGKVAFLTDGRAISYAETYLGIIEHYKLAEIVGGPTAGTNGNVNTFTLPGDYKVRWTGMQVLKHDGSRHHGVGIQPTVPVSLTLAGVAEGRDEILEKGIEVVSR